MNILMVTIGYPPEQVGGTEVYVMGLVEALKLRGHQSVVAYIEPFEQVGAPEIVVATRQSSGTEVYIVRVNTAYHKLEFVVFDPVLRAKLIATVRQFVADLRPDLVHVHPLQLGFDSYLMEALQQDGNKVVMTFHSSTTTCARGDLIYMGREVCDTLMLQERCTSCLYHWKDVPAPAAAALSKVPHGFYQAVYDGTQGHAALQKVRSFASIPLLIEARFESWTRATESADAVVAVCEWVQDTTVKNGVPANKVTLSRHGLRIAPELKPRQPNGVPRFGYLGRISPEKGIDSLLAALQSLPPTLQYEFEFCSSSFKKKDLQGDEARLVQAIYQLQARDARVRVLTDVADDGLAEVLAQWDALIVPSLWLESGPQVVYEAFAVQTPVIGSRRGGIAELVSDGKTGFLHEPGKAEELADLLAQCAADPARLQALRANIAPVRLMEQVADDMLKIYSRLTAQATAVAP